MPSFKLIALFAVIAVVALTEAYPRLVVIDDEYLQVPDVRVRRQAGDQYQPAASEPSYGGAGYKGKVGPVYTFVKTDPKANFKWGVRHRVGAQYGR